MWALGLIVGALAGAIIAQGVGAFFGGSVGLVIGFLVGRRRDGVKDRVANLESQVFDLETRLNALDERLVAGAVAARSTESAGAFDATDKVAEEAVASQLALAPNALDKATSASTSATELAADSVPKADQIFEPSTVDLGAGYGERESAMHATRPSAVTLPAAPSAPPPAWLQWIIGGNTLARVGVLLLFIGVGFLLKYASEHVSVPIEMRLSGVAAGAIALLVLGWRLRVRRTAYAMILQGAAVGVLYLTVFAALKLYAVLPPWATIILLLLIAALSSSLAVLQNSIALAVLGIVGGFLAPILTSTNAGDHVLLFSYYALLNAAVFGIAWFKAWRSLNLLGFVFTFVIGTFWGVTRYRPQDFWTTEPFLILFFLFYVGIAVLYALRKGVEVRSPVDATLVFGTPLIAAALQSGMVRNMPFGMALSALAMAALYLVLARVLYSRRGEGMRLLVESFLALGIIFATLAIPLALDARWTSASWALEGAAMLWAGIRQQRWQLRAFGILLQLGAGVAFGRGMTLFGSTDSVAVLQLVPLLNSNFIGAVLLALAGLYSAWLLWRNRATLSEAEQPASAMLFLWGCGWWLLAGWREIERWLPADMRIPALVAYLALTAVAFAFTERRLNWAIAGIPARALLPALLLIAIGGETREISGTHLFAGGGYLAWPLALVVLIGLLRRFDRLPRQDGSLPAGLWHAGTLWLVCLVAAHELAYAGRNIGDGSGIWTLAPWGIVPAVALIVVTRGTQTSLWPFAAHRRAYLLTGAVPLVAALVLWTLIANLGGDGDPLPLSYFPLLNPLDLTQALAFVASGLWLVAVRAEDPALFERAKTVVAVTFTALSFIWINALVLRTIHFWFDVRYDIDSLWASMLVQATFSLLWSTIALATMLLAHRKRWRTAWLGGAVLLGAVVIKLLLVDLGQVGGIERIVSFIGVGLLLLLIGYVAPVPPRASRET